MEISDEAGNMDKALTCREAATFLATTIKTLEAWRARGKGPAYLKQGRSVRYRLRDLLAFQAESEVIPPNMRLTKRGACAAMPSAAP